MSLQRAAGVSIKTAHFISNGWKINFISAFDTTYVQSVLFTFDKLLLYLTYYYIMWECNLDKLEQIQYLCNNVQAEDGCVRWN